MKIVNYLIIKGMQNQSRSQSRKSTGLGMIGLYSRENLYDAFNDSTLDDTWVKRDKLGRSVATVKHALGCLGCW